MCAKEKEKSMMKKKNPNKGEHCMNKKLILAAMAVVLTAGCAQAATNITGVTGTNGVYNITPEHFSGIAGYRKYDNFTLDQGDKANLQFVRNQEGKADPTAFVNLVENKVNINGVLNTMRGENFFNGHAIFITPGGFVVGQSGVLNVGRLSVATPTTATYNKLLKDDNNNSYGDVNFDYAQAIGRRVSKLTQNSDVNLPSNNADVTVNGYVFTRAGAELGGKAVAVPGHIVNGVKTVDTAVASLSDAETLFGTLVNTNGTVKAANGFQAQGGRILLKSSDSLNVSGTVTNGTGETYLTNNGTNGLAVSGKVAGTTYARLYNTKGDLAVNDGAYVSAAQVDARNQSGAGALTLASGSTLNGTSKVQVKNQGSGALSTAGTLSGKGTFSVKNYGSGMTVGGTITNSQGDTAIRNDNGAMTVDAAITNSNGNMGIINEGSGMTVGGTSEIKNTGKLKIANNGTSGLTVYGKVDNTGETRIYNDAGKLTLGTDTNSKSATITNKTGKLYIASRKTATGLSQSAGSTISNTGDNLVIRNSGTNVASDANGLDLQGTISSSNGILAINNDYGKMNVSSNITASNGNVGIINRSTAKAMTVSGGSLNVTGGNANVKNFGNGNMTVSSAITHNGRVNVLANKGKLTLGSKVTNNSGALSNNGGFYAASRVDGTGIEVTNAFDASGAGEVLIKNISGSTNGLTYAGKIDTTGNQAALVNKNGQMTISGTMKTTNGQVVVSNRGKNAADNATKLTITKDAVFNSGTKGKLVNTGTQASDISKDATFTNMEQWEKITTDK